MGEEGEGEDKVGQREKPCLRRARNPSETIRKRESPSRTSSFTFPSVSFLPSRVHSDEFSLEVSFRVILSGLLAPPRDNQTSTDPEGFSR